MIYRRLPPISYKKYFVRRLYQNSNPPYVFAYARTALKFGLQVLELKKGDFVLIPEYICDTVIHPLDQLGILPQYYTVNEKLEPDWDDVKTKLHSNVKAIMMVHYFGQPQDIAVFQSFCRQHNRLLIEDNAHGHGGTFNNKLLGTFGDIGISSPRKSFPVINGAFLYSNVRSNFELSPLPLQPFTFSVKQIRTIINYFFLKSSIEMPLCLTPQHLTQDVPEERWIPDMGMDQWTFNYLTSYNLEETRKIRHSIYKLWQQWAASQGLSPVFDCIHPETMPLGFAAYSESADKRLSWFKWGCKHGIDIYSWPTLPKEIVKKNGAAMHFWKHLVFFPIHQNMNPDHLQQKLNSISPP